MNFDIEFNLITFNLMNLDTEFNLNKAMMYIKF